MTSVMNSNFPKLVALQMEEIASRPYDATAKKVIFL